MATDFLNDARREIEGRTEDFYRERGSGTEPDGADNPAFLAKSAPEQKKTAAAGTDGGYGDAGTGAAGGLRWPEKGRL